MKADFDNIRISKIGASIPKQKLDLRTLTELGTDSELKTVIKTTGISSVRIAGDKMTASDLCIAAAKNILSAEDYQQIDALLFVSQTRDYLLPQTSFVIQAKLGLRKDIFCLDIPLGCSGYINGLFQASLLLQLPNINKVLVLAGDTSTKMLNKKDRATRMVFGDAGSATLMEKGEDQASYRIMSDGKGKDNLIVKAGQFRNPSNEYTCLAKEMEEGNFRSDEDLYMGGMDIFNFALREVPVGIDNHLADLSLDKSEVDLYLLHQANKFMVDYLRKYMKIKRDKVPVVVDGYGNTGPSTIPLLLSVEGDIYKTQNQLERVLMCGFGVGLSWGTAYTNLEHTEFYKPIEI